MPPTPNQAMLGSPVSHDAPDSCCLSVETKAMAYLPFPTPEAKEGALMISESHSGSFIPSLEE